MKSFHKHFNNIVSKELLDLFIGYKIGEGAYRCVFEFLPDPDLVVKFESTQRDFENVLEWETWRAFENNEYVSSWLAPCKMISPCGLYLVQERTQRPLEYPDKLPVWLGDRKRSNFGVLGNGNFVCHDYGGNTLQSTGPTKKQTLAKWWETP